MNLTPLSLPLAATRRGQPWTALHAPALAVGLLVVGLLGCSSEPSAPAAQKGKPATAGSSAPASAPAPAPVKPKSVFSLALKAARDPFFPESTRGSSKEPASDSAARPVPVNSLKLSGIRSGTTRPMALINRTPLAVGEEGDITILSQNGPGKPAQKVSVRCLEIRRDSVLIQVAGEPGVKELRMAQGK